MNLIENIRHPKETITHYLLLQRRKKLSNLIEKGKWDEIGQWGKRYGLSIIDQLQNLPGLTCETWVFGPEVNIFGIEEIVTSFMPVSKPERGDIAMYYRHSAFSFMRRRKSIMADIMSSIPNAYADQAEHVGLVASNDTVISKWGKGHVYQHPSLLVPLNYGYRVAYFRPPSDYVLRKLP